MIRVRFVVLEFPLQFLTTLLGLGSWADEMEALPTARMPNSVQFPYPTKSDTSIQLHSELTKSE